MRRAGLVVMALLAGAVLAGPAGAVSTCLDGSGSPAAPGGDDGPLVCFDASPADGGLTRYDVSIDPNSATTGTLAILIDFRGLFSQIRGFGDVIDEDGDAETADRFDDDYTAANDSFFITEDVWTQLNPFPDRLNPNGIRGGEENSELYQLSAGTLSPFGGGATAALAQLVAEGPVEYEGTVSFQGEDYAVSGILVPEPGTAGLLGMGLLGLAASGRRRRGA